MEKKLVFISHITEEKELAQIISEAIKTEFIGMLDTFVSSDGISIPAGSKWFDDIDKALTSSVIQISLCSPKSINRPWINFEAGASWIRQIPIIPICHSGLKKNELPPPLSMLQGANVQSEDDLKVVFQRLSDVLGSKVPKNIDYKAIMANVAVFENDYTYTSNVKQAIYAILSVEPGLSVLFIEKKHKTCRLEILEHNYQKISDPLEYLKSQNLISVSQSNNTIFTNLGQIRQLTITTTEKYNEISLD